MLQIFELSYSQMASSFNSAHNYLLFLTLLKNNASRDFPGGAVVKNPPASAGDMGSSPGPGRSHMPRSNEARVPQLLKPASLEPVLCNKRSHCNEKPTHHNEE